MATMVSAALSTVPMVDVRVAVVEAAMTVTTYVLVVDPSCAVTITFLPVARVVAVVEPSESNVSKVAFAAGVIAASNAVKVVP